MSKRISSRWMVASLAVGICLPQVAHAGRAEQRGLQIAQMVKQNYKGFRGEHSTIDLILISAGGDRVTRKMTGKVLETGNDGDKSILKLTWPPDVKDTRLLTWSHKRGADDQWLYLPSIHRVKRISSRSKTGSFMGSEFTYEDLVRPEVEQYHYKYIRDDVLGPTKSWVVAWYPNDKRSGYTKKVSWVDQKRHVILRMDYYDRANRLEKTAIISGYKSYGRYLRAGKIEMLNHQTHKKSIFVFTSRSIGNAYSSDDFEPGALKN